MRMPILSLLVLLLLTPITGLAGVVAPEVETLLTAARPDTELSVIITRTDPVDVNTIRAPTRKLRRTAIVSRLRGNGKLRLVPLIAYLKKNGARRTRELWMTNSVAAVLPASSIDRLRTYPGIASIRLDQVVRLPQALPAAAAQAEWNVSAIGATDLWNLGITGSNVVVAAMDSGVDADHLDLLNRWRGGSNSWYDPNDEHPVTPTDKDGHGTGVMSVIVGGNATGTSIGVAPGARWIAVKIFNDAGVAEQSAIHLGFQWLLDPDGNPATDDAPDVVNNSWGYQDLVDHCYLEFQSDIQILRAADIAVVFSSGNEGPHPATSVSPANNPGSLAVGAVDTGLNLANFSSRGPSACILEGDIFPELVAPGVNVKVADLTFNGLVPTATRYIDGTSFAAPHVAGGMALLREAFPGLGLTDLEAALMDAAVDLGVAGPEDDYGFGLMDLLATYRALVPCSDGDADGYFAEPVCSKAQDCDDTDPGIYPGADEIKHDGIDQDCNGYDLTIDIRDAIFLPHFSELTVAATSLLADQAGLALDGFGPMNWNAASHRWELTVTGVGVDPGSIAVSGIEGSVSAATLNCPGTVDSDGDGRLDACDNCIDVANADQRDSNGDGYGNRCDTDLNNDLITNGLDVGILKTQFLTAGPDADFNGDAVVNGLDVGILRQYFLRPPGPSGLVP